MWKRRSDEAEAKKRVPRGTRDDLTTILQTTARGVMEDGITELRSAAANYECSYFHNGDSDDESEEDIEQNERRHEIADHLHSLSAAIIKAAHVIKVEEGDEASDAIAEVVITGEELDLDAWGGSRKKPEQPSMELQPPSKKRMRTGTS